MVSSVPCRKFSSSTLVYVEFFGFRSITREEKIDVITVPVAAVLQDGQGNDVVRVVLTDGTTRQVQVKVGLSEGAYVEITEGLSGEELVLVET